MHGHAHYKIIFKIKKSDRKKCQEHGRSLLFRLKSCLSMLRLIGIRRRSLLLVRSPIIAAKMPDWPDHQ